MSRAGQLLAQPAQPMHLAAIEDGPAAELLAARAAAERGIGQRDPTRFQADDGFF